MGKKIFGGVFLLVFGSAFFGIGLWFEMRRKAVADYVPTGGRIVSAEVGSHRDSDGDTMYEAEFRYTYTVDGTQYEGTDYTYTSISSSSSGGARKLVARFPAGSECTVYHDPEDPLSAVLDKQPGGMYVWFPRIFLGVGGIILLVPIVWLAVLLVIAGTASAGGRRIQQMRQDTPGDPGRRVGADHSPGEADDLPEIEEM